MPTLIPAPVPVAAAGNTPKLIDEYVAVCPPAFAPELAHRDQA